MPRPLMPHRRERILDAAEALIVERGFEAMLIQQVAERVGIGKGAIYREFASKTELVHEVLARAGDRLWQAVSREVEAVGARRFSAIYRIGIAALFADPIMLAAYTHDRAMLGSYVETGPGDRYEGRLRRLTEYLGELQRSGAVRADLDVRAAATALASASIGLAYAGTLLGGLSPARLDATAGVIADMIERGLETGTEPGDPRSTADLVRVLFEGGPRKR